MDISAAVDALCSASDEDIKRHLSLIEPCKVGQAIRKLRKLAPKPDEKPPSHRLAEDLAHKFTELEKIVKKDPEDAVGRPPAEEEDYRLLDILVVEGGGCNELRRGFAQLSMANDFNNQNPGQLQTILNNKSFKLPKGTKGSIRAYIRTNFPEHQSTARGAVATGLRLLAIGIASSCLCMSVVLAFVQDRITTMEFPDVMAAFELPALSDVKRLAADISSWTVNAWKYYSAQGPYRSLTGTGNAMHTSSGPALRLDFHSLHGPTLHISHGAVETDARSNAEPPQKRRKVLLRPTNKRLITSSNARTNQLVPLEGTGESVYPQSEERHEWEHEEAEGPTTIQSSAHVNTGLRTDLPLPNSGRPQLSSPPSSEGSTQAPVRYPLPMSGGIRYSDGRVHGVIGSEGAAGDQHIDLPSTMMERDLEIGEWDLFR